MTLIQKIRTKIRTDKFELSEHAVHQSLLREITTAEIRQAVANGKIIETYPTDKYYPGCLISGRTNEGRPLHVQCTFPDRPLIKLITVYEPDPAQWIDFTTRRKK